MTNPDEMEEERAAARSRALRGVSGDFVPNPDSVNRPPTPMGILGPRAAEDKSKRRKKIDDAEEDALRG